MGRQFLSGARLAAVFLAALLAAPLAHADATDICFNYYNAQDYARAENEARALLQRGGLDRVGEMLAHLCLGKALSAQGRARDALPAFQQLEALSQSTKELVAAYVWLGSVYQGVGDLDRAELYDRRALKAARELGDKSLEASMLSNLGLVAQARGDTERALALYQESLALQSDGAKKPTILNNMAVIYLDRKDYAKAVTKLRQAIEINRKNGDAHSLARYQLNLGDVLRRQGKLKDAEKELTAGYNAIRLIGDKSWEAAACGKLAALSFEKNDVVLGRPWREWGEEGVALYRAIGDNASADALAKIIAQE
ncbi:tetratricopeptide repeat protein [Ferriphaselus sp. R-1]|uniref:tetratricopeptide repeat protein n=1 Tax=Ferriphaselus sp. R-1 TaxID=1485544 RepID=UPI000552F578|nr:tetratricopeptide repeat protein [Ferriphaselus sp. R-1]